MAVASYLSLRPDKIIETQARLRDRIGKRFPDSGLAEVAGEVLVVTKQAAARAEVLRRPHRAVRFGVALLLLGAAAIAVVIGLSLRVQVDLQEAMNLAQFIEAGLGSLVFVGVGVLFLLSLELRLKRRRALAALHELRAVAHVIDMHQLDKHPEYLLPNASPEALPTDAPRNAFELNRYLNYCIELLAIVSKVAAFYAQQSPDAAIHSAADQVEAVCLGLSQKIWHKLMLLEELFDEPRRL